MHHHSSQSQKIGIVGLGLIGGSLSLDLIDLGKEVYAVVNKIDSIRKAKENGLANFVSTDPEILSDCDLVILALPLESLLNPSKKLLKALPQKAVITDVGSVKEPVLSLWENLHPRFIGSHPMAGTNQSGIDAGVKGLFRDCPWVVTPNNKTDPNAIEKIRQFAIDLGCKWIITDAKSHDEAVTLISHLPLFISAALLETVEQESDSSILDLAKLISSSGFRDTSRVGGGNPKLGESIAINNTSKLLKVLHNYQERLKEIEKNISEGNWTILKNKLEKTKESRPGFLGNE